MRPQSETNPENAQHSTGPQSAEGKATSAQNARKHGIYSDLPILDDEDPAQYHRLRTAMIAHYQPQDDLEISQVDHLCNNTWRLSRFERFEDDFFNRALRVATDPHFILADAIAQNPGFFRALSTRMNTTIREVTNWRKFLTDRLNLRKKEARDAAEKAAAIEQRAQAEALAAAQVALASAEQKTAAEAAAHAHQEKLAAVNWNEIWQELYYAAAAGPQSPHPLPDHYYGAYVIWRKQKLMVDQDIGDDIAATQLAAFEVLHDMRNANIIPQPGTVWGSPEALAYWRAECPKHPELFQQFSELVLRDYARRDRITVEQAAENLRNMTGDQTIDDIPGPWEQSGDMADKDRAIRLARELDEAEYGEPAEPGEADAEEDE